MEQSFSREDELEIDLQELFAVLLQWLWLLLLSALIVGASAFAFSKFMITPTYDSTTRIVILSKQNTNNSITYSDLQMGTQLTKDYAELIRSRYVVEQVLNQFELDMGYEQFLKKMEVETPSDTRIIDITVTDPDPLLAKQMVDEIRNVAAVRIQEVMDIEAVNVVDEGNIASAPSNPNVMKWTLIGFLLGGFIAAAVVVLRYLLDDTIKSSEDIEKYLKLSTLALIPISMTEEEMTKKKGRRRSASIEADEDEGEEEYPKEEEISISDLSETETI